MALLLTNEKETAVENAVVSLNGKYEIKDTVNCTAHIDSDNLVIEKINALDFATVLLKKQN